MSMLTPDTPEGLAAMVRDAAATGSGLDIVGGGTRRGLGHPATADAAALALGAISGVTLYEPGALTLVVKTGTPVAEVEAVLAAERQRLAFEPMDHRALYGSDGEPTVGGMVAANVSGPRRIQAGACRDYLVGVQFVDGHGRLIRNGGRVMKNVTGYDLVKLMAGSHGTLGVLTEVAFKVLPAPEHSATIRLRGLDAKTAVDAMTAALCSPFEVNGAAHLPAGNGSAGAGADDTETLLRVEGFEQSVRYRCEQLSARLSPLVQASGGDLAVDTDPEATAASWRTVRDVRSLADLDANIWRVSVKPGDGPAVVAAAGSDARCQLDWGGGLVWIAAPAGTNLRERLAALLEPPGEQPRGHATLIRASEAERAAFGVFQREAPAIAALNRGLRQAFDPAGILNPGRMG